jgi:hypothetical protein
MRGVSEIAALDPERIVQTLNEYEVEYVLIGALAARLYGFPRLTADLDITPAKTQANLDRLARALRKLRAKIYTESIPEGLEFDCSAATLSRGEMWNLVTNAGRIDIAFRPSGTRGYDDIVRDAEQFKAYGVVFLAASLADIIRSKESANRPKDRDDVALLRAIQKRST